MHNIKNLPEDLLSKSYHAFDITDYDLPFPKRVQAIISKIYNLLPEVKSKLSFDDLGHIVSKNSWSFKFNPNLWQLLTEVEDESKKLDSKYYRTLFKDIESIINIIKGDILEKIFSSNTFNITFEAVFAEGFSNKVPDHIDPSTITFCLDAFGKGMWLGDQTIRYYPKAGSVLVFNGENVKDLLPGAEPLLHGSYLEAKGLGTDERIAVYLYCDIVK